MGKIGVDSLSAQQRRCLRLVGDGLSSEEIAHALGIAPGTVNGHIEQAVRKLGAPNRRRAARMLLDHEAAEAGHRPPEKIPVQILPLDGPQYSEPPITPDEGLVQDIERAAGTPAFVPPVSGGELEYAMMRTLRTIATIMAIAVLAGLIILIIPTLVANAEWIANRIEPIQQSR